MNIKYAMIYSRGIYGWPLLWIAACIKTIHDLMRKAFNVILVAIAIKCFFPGKRPDDKNH